MATEALLHHFSAIYVDGLSIDRLAPLHGRPPRDLRALDRDGTRAVRGYRKDTLGLAALELELDSMTGLVRSQLDLSLAHQLRSVDLRP